MGTKKYWKKEESYDKKWSQRTKIALELIDQDKVVYEFGCGPSNSLNQFGNFRIYRGFDLVPWSEKVTRLNLDSTSDLLKCNKFEEADYFVFLGVLEYLENVENVVSHFPKRLNYIVTSYCVPIEGHEAFRASRSWKNSLDENSLISLFKKYGFELTDKKEYEKHPQFEQNIYKFRNALQN